MRGATVALAAAALAATAAPAAAKPGTFAAGHESAELPLVR